MRKMIFLLLIFFLFVELSAAQSDKLSRVYGFYQPAFKMNIKNGNTPNNEFYINRFRLGLETKVYKSLKSEIELDPFEQNLIKDADIRWIFYKYFELVVGKFKKPFSLERLTSVREIPFLERSKIVKEMDNLDYAGRDLGMQLSVEKKFEDIDIKFSAGVFNGNPNSVIGDNNNQKSFAQRLELTPLKQITFAINSSQKYDTLSKKYLMANGADFIIKPVSNIKITSEFLVGKRNQYISTGGFYSLVEYIFSDFTFGFRYGKYFFDIKKPGLNIYETKVDWRLEDIIRIHINLVNEQSYSRMESNLFIGVSYVH